jgi:hypothetical protein
MSGITEQLFSLALSDLPEALGENGTRRSIPTELVLRGAPIDATAAFWRGIDNGLIGKDEATVFVFALAECGYLKRTFDVLSDSRTAGIVGADMIGNLAVLAEETTRRSELAADALASGEELDFQRKTMRVARRDDLPDNWQDVTVDKVGIRFAAPRKPTKMLLWSEIEYAQLLVSEREYSEYHGFCFRYPEKTILIHDNKQHARAIDVTPFVGTRVVPELLEQYIAERVRFADTV